MNSAAHLRLIPGPDREPTSLSQLFHRVNRLLPEDQEVQTVPPDMKVSDALKLMQEHRYSQLPVAEGNSVLGVFSYRSFSLEAGRLLGQQEKVEDLTVVEFLEPLPFAHIADEFRPLIDHLNHHDAILIGDMERLQGIVTPMDVLMYLYGVANAFVLLGEIELALRALISHAVTAEQLRECIRTSLSQLYSEEKLPSRLEELAFNDHKQLICDGRNWEWFQIVFGGTRRLTAARLKPICELRNDVFHFKREITVKDHQTLANCRDWLLVRARLADARMKGGHHD